MKGNKVVYIVVGVLLLSGLFLIFRPKTNPPAVENQPATQAASPQPIEKVFEYAVKSGQIISGQQTVKVTEGEQVVLKVTTDSADELHLHGYEKFIELEKDIPGELRFTANLTGRYVFELERTEVEIGALEVSPK